MVRSLVSVLAMLALAGSAFATPTSNPFECDVPIEALPRSLSEFQIISVRTQNDPFNLHPSRATVYAPDNVRVLGFEATHLEMVQSDEVITLSAFLIGSLQDVRLSVNRAAPSIVWVCSNRNDCGATSPARLLLRVSTVLEEETVGPRQPGSLVALTCTYNENTLGGR